MTDSNATETKKGAKHRATSNEEKNTSSNSRRKPNPNFWEKMDELVASGKAKRVKLPPNQAFVFLSPNPRVRKPQQTPIPQGDKGGAPVEQPMTVSDEEESENETWALPGVLPFTKEENERLEAYFRKNPTSIMIRPNRSSSKKK